MTVLKIAVKTPFGTLVVEGNADDKIDTIDELEDILSMGAARVIRMLEAQLNTQQD